MSKQIIVVGLGPGAWNQVTLEARDVLQGASTIWLRTKTHPTAKYLPEHLQVESFDYLYEREQSFAAIYRQIAVELLGLAAESTTPLIYCVPGHPLVGEASVLHLRELAAGAGISLRFVAGLSFIEPVCTAIGVDPLAQGMQILDGTELSDVGNPTPEASAKWLKPNADKPPTAEEQHEPFFFSPYNLPVPPEAFPTLQGLSTLLPALITQVYSDTVASAVKLALLEKYPPEHPVIVVMAAGVAGEERVLHMPLEDLDRGHNINHLACIYLPPLDPLAYPRDVDALIYLMGRLRGPGGCPWDREQSHDSIKHNMIEEAYEAVEAMDLGDPEMLAEELGDVLLQVIFHAQLAVSAEEFTLADVVSSIVTKLVRRHPHVFGDTYVAGADGVTSNWQTIKEAEKREKRRRNGQQDADEQLEVTGLLRSVPRSLPALDYSHHISERAVKAGFEWDDIDGVFAKVQEELQELAEATDPENRKEELGDLLFTLVNVARWWGINAEEALRAQNRKFVSRFAQMERLIVADNKKLRGMPIVQMETYWQAAKKIEKAAKGQVGSKSSE